jgi:hypothetical protein
MTARKVEVVTWIYGGCMYAVSTKIDGRLMETTLASASNVAAARTRAGEVWARSSDHLEAAAIPAMPVWQDPDALRPVHPISLVNLLNLKRSLQ